MTEQEEIARLRQDSRDLVALATAALKEKDRVLAVAQKQNALCEEMTATMKHILENNKNLTRIVVELIVTLDVLLFPRRM